MTDNTSPNPEQPDGDAGASGAPDGDQQPTIEQKTKAEIAKIARSRDDAKREAKREKERADALEAQLGELNQRISQFEEFQRQIDESKAAEEKNVEKLQKALESTRTAHQKQFEDYKTKAEKELVEERKRRETLEQKLYRSFVEKGLLEELAAHSTNAQAMKVQLQAVYQFEPVEDDDGNFVGVHAKDSDKSIQELHDELCDRLNLPFKKNPRQGGTGTPPAKPSPNGTKTSGIPSDIASGTATPERRRQWMAENPELALEVATQSLRR